MKTIVIAGATGLIGSALADLLRERGDTVIRLVRKAAVQPDEVGWNPENGELNPESITEAEAIVNLCGSPIARHWTTPVRRDIIDSRLQPTRTLVRALKTLGPEVSLINASAVGYYADRGAERLTETSKPGDGFVADLVGDWESAAWQATGSGNRVALARTGLVMAPEGGALRAVWPMLERGLAGPMGSGDQIWPWISLVDEVRALAWLIDHDISGPVNLTAPARDTNAEVVTAIAEGFGKSAFLRVPTIALRVAVGSFAAEIVASQHAVPQVLQDSGFEFRHAELGQLVDWLVPARREQ